MPEAPQEREQKKLLETIEALKNIVLSLPMLANLSTKALGIILGKIPKELSNIIDNEPENKVEMQCFGKTLERLWFYLNFYRQANDTVAPLRETAKSLMQLGKNKIQVTAFRITKGSIDNKFLNNLCLNKQLFFTTDPLEIFDLEHLLFIESSRALLESGDLKHFKTASGLQFLAKLLKLKMWIFENFSEKEVDNFLFIGSTILFSFGIRVPNDIDLYIHNDGQDKSFVRRFKKSQKEAPEGLFSGIDILLKDFGGWAKNGIYLRTYNYHYIYLPQTFGATNIKEVVDNPQFHYFFFGLKCVSLQGAIERKARQTRATAYADLLYMQHMQQQNRLAKNWSIPISRLREKIWDYEQHKWIVLGEEEHDQVYERIHKYLKKRYNFALSVEEIREKISQSSYIQSPYIEPLTGAITDECILIKQQSNPTPRTTKDHYIL